MFLCFHSCTVHLDTIECFIYPTDAQLYYSKNVKIYIKIYMRGAATCFGFSQPSWRKSTRYPLNNRLGEPQSRSGRFGGH